MRICQEKGKGFCLSINGFDDDPRDLWEIPDALDFLKRLLNLGFMTVLEVSTKSEEISGLAFELPGFGALELWLCATERMKSGSNQIDVDSFKVFCKDLESSNQPVRCMLKEDSIPDTSIQYHGFKR
jgi:hypothetical protein